MRHHLISGITTLVLLASITVAVKPILFAADRDKVSPDIYVPQAPQYVAGPGVENAEWSPDGRFVLLRMKDPENTDPNAPARIVVWSRRTHRAVIDWTAPRPRMAVWSVDWFPGTSTALVGIWEKPDPTRPPFGDGGTNLHFLRFDARQGSVTEQAAVAAGPSSFTQISPLLPYTVVIEGGEDPMSVRILRPDGLGKPVALPEGNYGSFAWSPDGGTFFYRYFGPYGTKVDYRKPLAWQAIDVRTGKLTTLTTEPALYKPAKPEPPFDLFVNNATAKDSTGTVAVHPLWLDCGGKPHRIKFVLNADARDPVLSPRFDAVLYRSDGMAFIRPLQRIPRAQFEPKWLADQQAEVERKAKEIGNAISFYAMDYGGNFPLADNVREAVTPFIRTKETWDSPGGIGSGFTYTLGGGPVPPELRKTTVVGYFEGDGGRAAIYADGHVTWMPNAS